MIQVFLGVFRPLRWYRNLFMLLGVAIAVGDLQVPFSEIEWRTVLVAFMSLCLMTSGNYGINEILDADADRFHPVKKNRAIPSGNISAKAVLCISVGLYGLGLLLVLALQKPVLTVCALSLVVSAFFYNVRPFRFKDYPYLDFMFEAVNNPLRLLVGWYSIASADQIVPSSFIMAYWFFGIFLMAAKRFGEIRFINDKDLAGKYRESFKKYNEQKLLISMVVSICASSYMLGALAMKHSVDLVLFLPVMAVWVAWFFHLAYESDSIVKDPERIFERIPFLVYSLFSAALFLTLIFTKSQIFGFIR